MIVTHHFSEICTRVIALYLHQNFVSAQYLENQLVEFPPNFIYASILTRSSLGLLHVIFGIFVPELWPLIYAKICFHSISWEQMDRISLSFIYAFILERSTLGLLHIIFCTFVPELWPLIYSKISFPLNILRTNGQIFTKLYITIYTDKIYVGIVSCHFSQSCKSVMALDWCQNNVTTQYPETLWPFTACKALQQGFSQILWQF